jgi:hypothetical protein
MELESEVDLMLEKFQKFIASIEAQYNRTLKIKQLNGKALKFYANQDKDVTVVHDVSAFSRRLDWGFEKELWWERQETLLLFFMSV